MTRARDTADLLTLAPTAQATEPVETLPLIINGTFRIKQRMDAETVRNGLNLQTSGYLTHDRWHLNINNIGDVDTVTSSEVPSGQGFKTSIEIRCRTADGSPAAGDFLSWRQIIEDQNCIITRKGHSDAKKLTVAFWVRSGVTGTYILELYDFQNSRQISQAYTISSANTWEKKVLVFPGDTTGQFANDTGQGLMCNWWLAVGSNYSSGTLSTTWTSDTTANRAVGQVNFQGTADKYFYLTGVQLEVGEYTATTIPPFRHLSYGQELTRCMRYLEIVAGGDDQLIGLGGMYSGSHFDCTLNTIVEKRATPTMIVKDASNHFKIRVDNESKTGDTIDTIGGRSHWRKQHLQINSGHIPAGISQGFNGLLATNNAAGFLKLQAEL